MKFSIFLDMIRTRRSYIGVQHSRVRRDMTGGQFSFPVSRARGVSFQFGQISQIMRKTNLLARPFPHFNTLCNCSSVQASRSTDLTRLIWVPIPRWMPEQRMQTKMPRFQEAHRGSASGKQCQIVQKIKEERGNTFVSFAVCAGLVRFELQQVLDGLLVLRSPSRVWSPRHGGRDRGAVCGVYVCRRTRRTRSSR